MICALPDSSQNGFPDQRRCAPSHPCAASARVQRLANNFGAFTNMVPPLLNMVDFAHRLVGPKPLEFLSRTLNKGTGNIVPTWNPYLPRVRIR